MKLSDNLTLNIVILLLKKNVKLLTIKDIIDFIVEMVSVKNFSYVHNVNKITLKTIRQSQGYLYAKEEGKLEQRIETIILLQELGLNINDIAKKLKLDKQIVIKKCK